MRSFLKSAFLAALLVQANAGVAQETTTEEDAAAPATEELSLGEPAGPAIGQPYVEAEYGDWARRCVRTADGNDPCNLYQLLVNDEGVAVAEFNIFQLANGGRAVAGATVVVPLETLLTEQLTLAVDGANGRRYAFNFCNAAGCVARFGLTQEEVDSFKRGAAATLRIVPAAAQNQEVVLDLSLSGFTAGFDATTPNQ